MFNISFLVAQEGNTSEFYTSMLSLPTQELYTRASEYQRSENTVDSAFLCYSVLSNRYASEKDDESKLLCIKSLAKMGYIHYFHHYDYPQAFAMMTKADELAKASDAKVSEIPLYYGLMYGSISQQSNDPRSAHTGMLYLRKAFDVASDLRDSHNTNLAYSNLVTLAYTSDMLDSISDVHARFIAMPDDADMEYYRTFNISLYNALEAMRQGNPAGALTQFEEMLESTPDTDLYSRYITGIWQYKALVHEAYGNYSAALDCLKEGLDVARRYNIKDAQIELYRQLADDASKSNSYEDKYLYQNEYLVLKDSLLNYQQVASIDEVRFLSEMKKAEAEIQEIEAQHRRLKIYVVCGLAALLIFITWFYALVVKNRQLRRREKSLYEKNVEVIRAEEQERRLRNRYQREVMDLRQQLESASPSEPDTLDSPVKYKGSNLSDGEKEALTDKIRQLMETSQEIFSPTFSSERLAALLDTNYKYVSQTINEMFGSNFNTLLNNYRIREACRRISDAESYGNLTLEALALSVGFKSRSTFVVQFKKITGLTPSQYQAEARKVG